MGVGDKEKLFSYYRYLYLLNWASPLVYTISLIFYLIDLGLDIVVGINMIDDFGGVILGVVFLPVLPMVGLYVMRNMYKVEHPNL